MGFSEYKRNNIKLPWQCTFGHKSHLNLATKVVFSPLILVLCVFISVCEMLFTSNRFIKLDRE